MADADVTVLGMDKFIGDRAYESLDGRGLVRQLLDHCKLHHFEILGTPDVLDATVAHAELVDGVRVLWQYDCGASGRPAGTYVRADVLVKWHYVPKPKLRRVSRRKRTGSYLTQESR